MEMARAVIAGNLMMFIAIFVTTDSPPTLERTIVAVMSGLVVVLLLLGVVHPPRGRLRD